MIKNEIKLTNFKGLSLEVKVLLKLLDYYQGNMNIKLIGVSEKVLSL